ncbi:hypothetical protein THOM_1248 [Trachipleistophora hominis]|uniref:Uncharacterized protein n=1 Tax=Trachipleistophora hominis TaxID=72359 RepID=L7JYH4_TRAHO|nr:hypothetical protein THOM_1248 [Trachipleistophora hominis]
MMEKSKLLIWIVSPTILGVVIILAPILLSWLLLRTADFTYVSTYESTWNDFATMLPNDMLNGGKAADNILVWISKKNEKNESVAIAKHIINTIDFKQEVEVFKEGVRDETYYPELFANFIDWDREEPENAPIPFTKMAEQKIIPRQNFLVRMAAKFLGDRTTCKIDKVFDFMLKDAPDGQGQYNAHIMHYDSNVLKIYQFLVNETDNGLKLKETIEIKLKDEQATTVYTDIIIKLGLLSIQNETIEQPAEENTETDTSLSINDQRSTGVDKDSTISNAPEN